MMVRFLRYLRRYPRCFWAGLQIGKMERQTGRRLTPDEFREEMRRRGAPLE